MSSAVALLRPVVVAALVVGVACATAVAARPSEAPPSAPLTTSSLTATDVTTVGLGRGVGSGLSIAAAASVPVAIPAPLPRAAAPRKAVRRAVSAPPAKPARARRTPVRESAQAHADRRGKAALAALDYPVAKLGYDVVFRPYTGGTLGLADTRTRSITLYVKRSHSDFQLRVSLAHEVGHVLDFTRSTAVTHRDYLVARGLAAGTQWFGCNGCTDYLTPAGDFAEVFALWLAGPGDYRSEMAPAPGRAKLAELSRRFFQAPG